MLDEIVRSTLSAQATQPDPTGLPKRNKAFRPFCRYVLQGSLMRTSLRHKLVRTMIATLIFVSTATLLVVAGMNYFASHKTLKTIEEHLRASIEDKGTGLVANQALGLRDLVMDNAFGDVARLVERTLEKDEQLVYGLFLDEEQKAWGFATRQGAAKGPDDWKQLAINRRAEKKPGVQVLDRHVLGQNVFEFSMAVVDDRGNVLGRLYYGMSDGPLQKALSEARADSRRALLLTVGLLVLLGSVTIIMGALRSRRSAARITQPVTDLTEAVNTLASGKRDIRVNITSGDELEILGGAFNNMAAELKDSYERLETMNRTLEIKVQERTRELADRNRDMRLVLDNVNQGFLTLSTSGRLAQERSAIVDRWFGSYAGETKFVDYIAKVDAMYAASFGIGYEALIEDVLPRELCLEQMPTRLRHDGREFRCSYFAITKGEQLDGLLIVINDVTAELQHARQEAERKEILAMFEALTKDRSGFLCFIDESNELFKQVREADLPLQKRILHTLKGNAALVGFAIVANLCQRAEDALASRLTPLPAEALVPLEQRWATLNGVLKTFLGDKGRDVLELRSRDVEKLEEEIRAGASAARLLDRLASWWLEASELPLGRLARYAAALAMRLGKGEIEVEIQAHGVRLSPKAWAGFWTDLVHVVRNAVDHGLETEAERASAGKTGAPRLRFSTAVSDRTLLVEVEDDGRGINWEGVKGAAIQMGLPAATEDDLLRALFALGLSTKGKVTTVSGRGVGLSAIRHQVDDLGGQITVISKPKQGTCFRFTFPLPEVGPRFGVETVEEAA
jgi:two-component system chemotaxis sensor kinase CheA